MTSSNPSVRVLVLPARDDKAYLQWLIPDPQSGSNLKPLQDLVGGDIEPIGLTAEAGMYVNEEGLYLNLPRNENANLLFASGEHVFVIPGDYLKGPAVVFGRRDARGRDDGAEHDVPQSILDLCVKKGVEVVDRTTI